MKPVFEMYLENLIDEFKDSHIQVKKLVLDAPERAACRKQKQHGGYFSCDLCLANPENIDTQNRRHHEHDNDRRRGSMFHYLNIIMFFFQHHFFI